MGLALERPAGEAFLRKMFPNCRLVRMPKQSAIDWMVISDDDRLICYLEIKARRVSAATYPSTIVTWSKYEAARDLKRINRVPSFCVVVYQDNVGSFELTAPPSRKTPIYRRDRGTSADHAEWDNDKLTYHPELLSSIGTLGDE